MPAPRGLSTRCGRERGAGIIRRPGPHTPRTRGRRGRGSVIPATQLRAGMAILHEGNLCRVLSVLHLTPGNWRGMVQTKLRNVMTGNSFDYRFRSEDRVERADLEQHEMEFLYASGDDYHFM